MKNTDIPEIKSTLRQWKRYAKMKNSGISWLGKIPEGWEVKKLKFIVSNNLSNVDKKTVDGQMPVKLCNYVDVYYNNFITSDIEFMKASATKEQVNKFSLKGGDVLITKDSESPDDIAVPAYVDSDLQNILCGYHLSHIRPKPQINGKYLFRSFVAYGIRDQFCISTNGITRFGLSKYSIDNALFLIPPKDEQISIAGFLDRETGKIAQMIEKKERQIELLKEKRTALISHAVTKGLNPNAKLKDSGIPLLGQIPERWGIKKLKFIVQGSLSNGLFKKNDSFGSGTKLVNVFDVYQENFIVNNERLDRVETNEQERKKYSVEWGDVFFVRSSLKLEGVGRSVCAIDILEPTVFECHIVRARPNKFLIDPKFLIHFLNSIHTINRLISLANLVTMATIDQDKIKSLEIPLPSLNEQSSIMEFLDRETGKIDSLIVKVQKSIKKLREYRTALISAAVTGKIDVREEVA